MDDFTGGEWKVTQWNRAEGFNVFSDNGFIASVPLDSGRKHTMGEAKANAYLISSAPDMYKTLEKVVKYSEKYSDVPFLAEIKQALAKARAK